MTTADAIAAAHALIHALEHLSDARVAEPYSEVQEAIASVTCVNRAYDALITTAAALEEMRSSRVAQTEGAVRLGGDH